MNVNVLSYQLYAVLRNTRREFWSVFFCLVIAPLGCGILLDGMGWSTCLIGMEIVLLCQWQNTKYELYGFEIFHS